ncbi:MAG: ribonucleotide reductase N-terminal alpha domain-containing protein, partial [Planctomycetota bacterium]
MKEGLGMANESPVLSDNALRVLQNRYLIKDARGRIVETPAEMFARVSSSVAAAERAHGASARDVEALSGRFYRMMAAGTFLPNSPTLMNAGRELSMLSACFVLPVDDSVEAIFESVKT